MQGEITPAELIDLDSILTTGGRVKIIRKQVEQHEKGVIEKPKRLKGRD